MIGTTQNLSARIAIKGFLCTTVLTLVLLATLALVASAHATLLTVQQEGTTLEVDAAPEGTTGSETATGGEPEGNAPAGEGSSAEGTLTQTEGSSPPAEGSEPAETEPAESTPLPQEGHAGSEIIQTTVSQVEEALEPVIGQGAGQAAEVAVPSSPAEERLKSSESAKEATQAEAIAVPILLSSPPSGPQAAAKAPVAAGASPAILGTLPAIPATKARERSAAAEASSGGVPLSAAQRAGEISCQLSGLSENCSAGPRPESSLIVAGPVQAAGEASPAHRNAPAGGGYSEPAGGGRSGPPPSSPPPGGAFGGSAAAGSGLALSGFFTLAGLILFAAPCAMRRLRLACRPWRTAFFVLIPERPG